MNGERIVLEVIRIVGYANFFALTFLILSMKGSDSKSSLLLPLPPSISLIGTVGYYFVQSTSFVKTPNKDFRNFMRPYILGAALTVSAAALVIGLAVLNRPTV